MGQDAHRQGQNDPVLGLVHLHPSSLSALAEEIRRGIASALPATAPADAVQVVALAPAQFARLEELLKPGFEASKLLLAQMTNPAPRPAPPAQPDNGPQPDTGQGPARNPGAPGSFAAVGADSHAG
jgi:hypothetical protein